MLILELIFTESRIRSSKLYNKVSIKIKVEQNKNYPDSERMVSK